MPASNIAGRKAPGSGARAIVEPLGLDAGALGDGDFSALSLQHTSGQYTNSDLDTLGLANFQAELELDNINPDSGNLGSEYEPGCDVLVTSEETVECVEIDGTVDHEEYLYQDEEEEAEVILPDLEEPEELSSNTDSIERMTISPSGTLRPTTVRRPISVSTNSSQGQSIILVQSPQVSSGLSTGQKMSVSSGQIVTRISNSNIFTGIQQLHQQTIVTARSASGNIIQLLPTNTGKPIMTTGVSSNIQGNKSLQNTLKRPATSNVGGARNVYAKVIISGKQQQVQPITLATSMGGESSGQPIKLISASPHQTTRAITLAQAQQMGLISPSKLQQILPSSPTKQGGNIVVNKIMGSPIKGHPTKILMQPAGLKSPTKILPAPISNSTLKPVSSGAAGSTIVNTINTSGKPILSPQKVVIRQGSLKSGTMTGLSAGQVIRIPASHNLGGSGNFAQIQIPGTRQLQYVRLVSASGSNTSTVTTTTRPRMVPVSSIPGGLRPVAISSVRATGQTVKMVPIAPATSNIRLAGQKALHIAGQPGQRILIPSQSSQIRTVTTSSGQTIMPSVSRNITYMLPAQYTVQQVRNQTPSPVLPASILASSPAPSGAQAAGSASAIPSPAVAETPHGRSSQPRPPVEPNGLRPRKPCNCTKSQCLKLYCDCFANGEFCYMCNCNNCFNNLQHEEDRQTAIKSCLERNVSAFRPKIGKGHVGDERRHNKGCNCKRSGCLKNYCECYEAKIPCSHNCKCVGCRNIEETGEMNSLRDLADAAESRVQQMTAKREANSPNLDRIRLQSGPPGYKPQFNFVTSAVVAATVECLSAIAEEAETNHLTDAESERLMLEEFGRCLKQVIHMSDKAESGES